MTPPAPWEGGENHRGITRLKGGGGIFCGGKAAWGERFWAGALCHKMGGGS